VKIMESSILQEKILNKLYKQIQVEIDIMGIQLDQMRADFELVKANTEMDDAEKFYNIEKFIRASDGITHKINMISNLSTPYRDELKNLELNYEEKLNELSTKELSLSGELHSYKNELAKMLGLMDWVEKYKDIMEGVIYD
jgi:hypothetical protein